MGVKDTFLARYASISRHSSSYYALISDAQPFSFKNQVPSVWPTQVEVRTASTPVRYASVPLLCHCKFYLYPIRLSDRIGIAGNIFIRPILT